MADEMVPTFVVKYEGREADSNVLEGIQLGESIYGSAKFYTAVAHYCFFGEVPRRNYRAELGAYARPSERGSYEQLWFIAPLIAGEYSIHAQLYQNAFSLVFQKAVDGIKRIWTRPSETQQVITTMADLFREQARANADMETQLLAGIMRQSEMLERASERQEQAREREAERLAGLASRLLETLPQVARATRPQGVRIVAPVGRTCSEIAQFAETAAETRINEPEAEVIRGKGDMEVGKQSTFQVNRITELNLGTGHCVLQIQGIGEVTGRITDPVLKTPENIYTRSLDKHTTFTVSAKPVTQNGEIKRLYISDAE